MFKMDGKVEITESDRKLYVELQLGIALQLCEIQPLHCKQGDKMLLLNNDQDNYKWTETPLQEK